LSDEKGDEVLDKSGRRFEPLGRVYRLGSVTYYKIHDGEELHIRPDFKGKVHLVRLKAPDTVLLDTVISWHEQETGTVN
jgi:hypothetical protein